MRIPIQSPACSIVLQASVLPFDTAAGILGFLLLCLVVKFTTTSPFPNIDTEHDQEKVFKSSSGENATEPFPSLGKGVLGDLSSRNIVVMGCWVNLHLKTSSNPPVRRRPQSPFLA